jgi:hypothetical protein
MAETAPPLGETNRRGDDEPSDPTPIVARPTGRA